MHPSSREDDTLSELEIKRAWYVQMAAVAIPSSKAMIQQAIAVIDAEIEMRLKMLPEPERRERRFS